MIVFEGMDELRQQLRNLPTDLGGEAAHIIEASANAAAATIKAGYPARTGNLRDHVYVTHERTQFGAIGIVKNTAKHAWIFENGTQARHTDLGANRGSMPAGHVFVPAVIRERKRMYEDLKDLVVRHGLEVTDDAG